MYKKTLLFCITLLATSGIKASQKEFPLGIGLTCTGVTCTPGRSEEVVMPVVTNWARKQFIIMPIALLSLIARFVPDKPITTLSIQHDIPIHQIMLEGRYTTQELEDSFYHNDRFPCSLKKKQLRSYLYGLSILLGDPYFKKETRSFNLYILGTWNDLHAMDTTCDKKMSDQLKIYMTSSQINTSAHDTCCYFPPVPDLLERKFNIQTNPPFHIFCSVFRIRNENRTNNPNLYDQVFNERHRGQHVIVALDLKDDMNFDDTFENNRCRFIDEKSIMYHHWGKKQFLEYYHTHFPPKEESSSEGDLYDDNVYGD